MLIYYYYVINGGCLTVDKIIRAVDQSIGDWAEKCLVVG